MHAHYHGVDRVVVAVLELGQLLPVLVPCPGVRRELADHVRVALEEVDLVSLQARRDVFFVVRPLLDVLDSE